MKYEDEVAWTVSVFRSLKQGSHWFMPRCGLDFEKRGNAFVLVRRMPWMEEMSDVISPEQLRAHQDTNYHAVKRRLASANIEVRSEI